MQYIVQGFNPKRGEWETLTYQTESLEERTACPVEYMAKCAARFYEEEWGGAYRVVESEEESLARFPPITL